MVVCNFGRLRLSQLQTPSSYSPVTQAVQTSSSCAFPHLSPAAPALLRRRAAQPTGFSPSAVTRHDASRIGSYSEKLIPSAYVRIPHAAWRGVVNTSNTSSVAGSRRGSVVQPSVAMNLVWTLVSGRPKHTFRDSHQLSDVVQFFFFVPRWSQNGRLVHGCTDTDE